MSKKSVKTLLGFSALAMALSTSSFASCKWIDGFECTQSVFKCSGMVNHGPDAGFCTQYTFVRTAEANGATQAEAISATHESCLAEKMPFEDCNGPVKCGPSRYFQCD